MASPDYTGSSAGDDTYNQDFEKSGTFNGKPAYVTDEGGANERWLYYADYDLVVGGSSWALHTSKVHGVGQTIVFFAYYYGAGGQATPPLGTYTTGSGVEPDLVLAVAVGRDQIETELRDTVRARKLFEQSVPNPFPNREKGEDERLTDIYGRLPKDNISRLGGVEVDLSEAQVDIVANANDIDDIEDNKIQTVAYTERWDSLTMAADGAWTDVVLSGYGVLVGDICEIFYHNNSADDGDVGVRTDGSSLVRLQADGGGMEDRSQAGMSVVAGTGGVIELYAQDASDIVFHLAGYWRFSTS